MRRSSLGHTLDNNPVSVFLSVRYWLEARSESWRQCGSTRKEVAIGDLAFTKARC